MFVEADVRRDAKFHAVMGLLLGNHYSGGHSDVYGRLLGIVFDLGRRTWDTPPEPIVNHPGGLLDLRTGANRPHTPEFLSTQQLAVAIDVDGECPKYDRWVLERVGAEQALVLDALMAQALDGSQPSSKAGLLFGTSRTGKSTVLRLVKTAFGDEQVASVSMADLGSSKYAVGSLRGKAINLCGEIAAKDVSDLTAFKSITGGDRLFADVKYGPAISFATNMSLLFAGNSIPAVPAEDAFFARMVPVAFPRSYLGREDPSVEAALVAELPSILGRWARAYGKASPVAHPAVMEFFSGRTDRVAQFLAECTAPCVVEMEPGIIVGAGSVGTPGAATSTQLAAAFRAWAELNNGAAMGRNRLVDRAMALGVQRILVGARGNKRALDRRILDPSEWDMAGSDAAALIPALWPDGEPEDDPDDNPTPGPVAGSGPIVGPTAPNPAALGTALADHLDQPLLTAEMLSTLIGAAIPGDSTALGAIDPAGAVRLVPPTVLLSDLAGSTDPVWMRAVLAASIEILDAAGLAVRERRLTREGDLASWTPATTGRYTSPTDVARWKTDAAAAAAAGATDQARALSLTAAATRGLPAELVGYAVALDTDRLTTTLGEN